MLRIDRQPLTKKSTTTWAVLIVAAWLLFGQSTAGLATAMAQDGLTDSSKKLAKPNIVLIYADDLGWMDVEYQGSDFHETPVLNQMARDGMTFSSAYSCAANCQPARACLLSGNYTPRHQVYAVQSTQRGPRQLMRLVPLPNRDGLDESELTLAEALKSAGYATGHFGKWHLFQKNGKGGRGALPSQQGFDVTYDSFGNGRLPEGSEGNKTGPPNDPKGVFELTDQACQFIEQHKHEPFFVYLAHHAVHGPLQGRPETMEKFSAKAKGEKHKHVKFAACVYDLDASVGRLLQTLDQLKLADNTVVIFTSDNGGTPIATQEPLRGSKGCYFEGGIREPMIVRWPSVVAPNSKCNVPVSQVDFFPTMLDLAMAKADKSLDGESLLPLLKQTGKLNRKSIFWHFPGYLDQPVTRGRDPVFRSRPVTVIRSGDWKLHLYHEEWVLDGGAENVAENNSVELYNITEDIGERSNVANQYPKVRDRLIAELLAWMRDTEAQFAARPEPE